MSSRVPAFTGPLLPGGWQHDVARDLSVVLQPRSNDEYAPVPYSLRDLRAVHRTREESARAGSKVGATQRDYASSRLGTAAALRAIDDEWGGGFYRIPPEATTDRDAANEALGGDQLIIDVQTHYIAPHRAASQGAEGVLAFIEYVAPDRWKGLSGAHALDLAEYLRCVYLESETAVAVLTSAPGDEQRNVLANHEIAGTRELVDRLAGTGRLLNHSIAHPNAPGELDRLGEIRDRLQPIGWKVYTSYGQEDWTDGAGWMLDDEKHGMPFLERSRALGVNIVCAHKGLSALAPTGSPADFGPAAAAFPDLSFLAYHSGYERPQPGMEEGPYSEAVSHLGTNRLVKTLRDSKIAPGSNVYAELGSTWFILMRRPREAAHVLGKLLLAVGEDNVLWGSDSIWYGSPQPLIDAFRSFHIPEQLCLEYGYPPLTPQVKEKILGLNAARVYGIDVAQARETFRNDDLAWVKQALQHYKDHGTPRTGG